MTTMNPTQRFLLAVRRLEREHGLYLHCSEWMLVLPTPPDDRNDGVLMAPDTHEETEELIAAWEAEQLSTKCVLETWQELKNTVDDLAKK